VHAPLVPTFDAAAANHRVIRGYATKEVIVREA
jgi:hypothetical protein